MAPATLEGVTSIEEIVRRIVREEVRAALKEGQMPESGCAASDELLGVAEAALLIGVAPQTLRNWRTQRKGPPAVKVGRLVKYRSDDLDRWVTEQAPR